MPSTKNVTDWVGALAVTSGSFVGAAGLQPTVPAAKTANATVRKVPINGFIISSIDGMRENRLLYAAKPDFAAD